MTNINNPSSVAALYSANALGTALKSTSNVLTPAQSGGGNSEFLDLLKTTATSAIDAQYRAEDMAIKGVAGEASLTSVTQAVVHAENTLQTVTAVRDRVISSYQRIMQMPI